MENYSYNWLLEGWIKNTALFYLSRVGNENCNDFSSRVRDELRFNTFSSVIDLSLIMCCFYYSQKWSLDFGVIVFKTVSINSWTCLVIISVQERNLPKPLLSSCGRKYFSDGGTTVISLGNETLMPLLTCNVKFKKNW